MMRLALALTIAAVMPLVGCQSPDAVARQRCAGTYPAGSRAYTECYQREFQRQYRFLEEMNELRQAGEHGGG